MDTNHDTPVCPDWAFLNNSNVHVAKDRGWFKTYTPFNSTVSDFLFASSRNTPVLGIGTVEIPTKRSPNRSGVSSHGTLHLKEVLHVPDFVCNVIGGPIFSDGYDVTIRFGPTKLGTIEDSQGKSMAYFDPSRPLLCIKVRNSPEGPKLGPYALQKDKMYALSCRWEPREEQRWLDYKARNGLDNRGSTQIINPNPPYTDEEKSFLKTNFRDEYHFLLQHGLKIHSDEDRAEGRRILRAIMREDDEEDSDGEPEDDEDDGSEFDLEGHQADYNFSAEQLDWIGEHYGNSEAFMISYGLRFYDDDDLEEAKVIADAMMHDDDD
ncbi:hypothetical protein yc1106_05018 [Curvularia clavata]|uniref:Retrovirus-related Pol polyprotein from transposon TNT 1-94-like beta-barrel domain-containing protein n=1 Tax=Curvularia clavata TaxID=95742 RepID=A0A9Q8Z823_CURCL|nr:hypothetical protein yc1106_05018 [Curvularia clavata]